jgi:hypothetical protein
MAVLDDFNIEVQCSYYKGGGWHIIPRELMKADGVRYKTEDAEYRFDLKRTEYGYEYGLKAEASYPTQMKLKLITKEEGEKFHLIPCNIYGDNNIDKIKEGEFPCLTDRYPGVRFCSPYWEFRADRASAPISALCWKEKSVGISIDPYSATRDGYIHNGVFAELPSSFGVTLGYTNLPVTFVDKMQVGESTAEFFTRAKAGGSIYLYSGEGRLEIHRMIREEYNKRHTRAIFRKSYTEAARAIVDTFIKLNWNNTWEAYTDMSCKPTEQTELTGWRPVNEIGWTGVGVLAEPFIRARYLLELPKDYFYLAKSGEKLIDQILEAYNPASGLLNDLFAPIDETKSLVNGWWYYYGVARDCHCAYNIGSALHAILKAIVYLKEKGSLYPDHWLSVSCKVLDTLLELQRQDGSFGYTYSTSEKKVLDWDGFAGCWFLPCMVYAWQLTGEKKYLTSAVKAEHFYAGFVKALNCYGTPMDTWKAVDEEGNLAFVRGTRLLHQYTGEDKYLVDLELGANYEYLWRYGYATRPENAPIKNGWNSCGGSVTSISNPHIHPMGVIIDEDLRYLAEQTRDSYHLMRADDSTAWLMQNLECYPEKAGYGQYGIISERWCPSDGLVTERYSDGRPYSSWFTYNLWATANVLDAILSVMEHKVL